MKSAMRNKNKAPRRIVDAAPAEYFFTRSKESFYGFLLPATQIVADSRHDYKRYEQQTLIDFTVHYYIRSNNMIDIEYIYHCKHRKQDSQYSKNGVSFRH